MLDSGKVKEYLREHPDIVRKNINDFVEEISILGEDPVLVALGSYTYDILNSYLGKKYRIAKIKHYSYSISKENYRKELLETLERF